MKGKDKNKVIWQYHYENYKKYLLPRFIEILRKGSTIHSDTSPLNGGSLRTQQEVDVLLTECKDSFKKFIVIFFKVFDKQISISVKIKEFMYF